MKKWLLSKLVTPKRVRKIVASVVSWLIYGAIARGIWDSVLDVAKWMRHFADFIESWDKADLPEDKDKIISELVSRAITDEAIDMLLEKVVAMKAEQLAILRGRQVGGYAIPLPQAPEQEASDTKD